MTNIWGYEKKLCQQKKDRVELNKKLDSIEDKIFFAKRNKQKVITLFKGTDDEEKMSMNDAEDLLASLKTKLHHLNGRIAANENGIQKERQKKKVKTKK